MRQTGEMRVQRPMEDEEIELPVGKKGKLRLLTPLPELERVAPAESADETADWIARQAEDVEKKALAKEVEKNAIAKARERQLSESRAAEQSKIKEIKRTLAERDTLGKKIEARKAENVDKVLEGLVNQMKGLNSRRSELETKLVRQSAGMFAALRRFKVFGGVTTELEIAKIDDEILMVENQMEAAIGRLRAFAFNRKGSSEEQILKGVKPLDIKDEREISGWFVDSEAEFIENAYHGEIRGGGWNPDGGSFLFYEDGTKVTLDKDGQDVAVSSPDGTSMKKNVKDLDIMETDVLSGYRRRYEQSNVGSRSILEGIEMDESNRDAIEQWFLDPKAEYDDEIYADEGVSAKTRKVLRDNILPLTEQKDIKQQMEKHRFELAKLEASRASLEKTIREEFWEALGDDFDLGDLQIKKSAWGRLLLKARLGKLYRVFSQLEQEYNYVNDKIARASEEVIQDELWLKDPHKAAASEVRVLVKMLQRRARAVPGSSASGTGEKTGIPAL